MEVLGFRVRTSGGEGMGMGEGRGGKKVFWVGLCLRFHGGSAGMFKGFHRV